MKIIVISAIGFNFVESRMTQFARTAFMGLKQGIAFVLESTVDLVFNICIIFVFIAALDFMYQRWDYERQLKMTKHEVKEEYKQLEGEMCIRDRKQCVL